MFTRNHSDRERMRQLCSLAALGEISAEDQVVLYNHLKVCRNCRELLRDLNEISLFDLSAVAVHRLEEQALLQENSEDPDEENLLAHILETSPHLHMEERGKTLSDVVPACPVCFSKRVKNAFTALYPHAGWALASLFLIGSWIYIRSYNRPAAVQEMAMGPKVPVSSVAAPSIVAPTDADAWQARAQAAQKQLADAERRLTQSQAQAQATAQQLAKLTAQYQLTQSKQDSLESQVTLQDAKIRQDDGTLSATQASLDDARSEAATLRARLQELNANLETQRTEVARLEQVAAKVPPRLPAVGGKFEKMDEEDVLGARDLHIVDVYDVDHAGKSAKIYGRVYYINHNFLLFYAFDLNGSTKNRRPVAFQAWGYEQPNSKKAESLGLFYLEDAKLDRWALRVTDPRLLARIDTLFVTVEPPGGSNIPRGKQLLMASLAGPPNHP